MAKKKSAKKRGMPAKECPQCHLVQHARKMVCEKCGYVFPQKPPKEKRGRRKGMKGAGAAATERAARENAMLAMEYVLFNEQGDIAKALQAVETFETSKLAEFIDNVGGKKQAASALASLQKRSSP